MYLSQTNQYKNDIEEKYVNEIIMLLRTIPTSKLIQPIMQLFIDNAILNNVQNDALLIEKQLMHVIIYVYGHCKVIVTFQTNSMLLY